MGSRMDSPQGPREHYFGAEASVLEGELHLPLKQTIHPQASVSLPEDGGYKSQKAEKYRLESVISYSSAHTQVSGNPENKPETRKGPGWNSLVTSAVEDLNILDVITADRVVAQIGIKYPLEGYIPSITFLGSRFDNLRIDGHEVKLDLCMDLCGKRAKKGQVAYNKDPDFVKRVKNQREIRKGNTDFLTSWVERLGLIPSTEDDKVSRFGLVAPKEDDDPFEDGKPIECSLVNQLTGEPPWDTCGHIIEVPNFGIIYLATVRLEHSDPHPETRVPKTTKVSLDMIHTKMGCLANGTATAAGVRSVGTTHP
jgi:hypothetical protein